MLKHTTRELISVEDNLNNISFDIPPLSIFHLSQKLLLPEFVRGSLKQGEKYIYIYI